jgi:hypothetical protein
MPVVLPVAMSIVKVIDMVIVLYGLVTASWTVDVFLMAFVRLMGHRNLLYGYFSGAPTGSTGASTGFQHHYADREGTRQGGMET